MYIYQALVSLFILLSPVMVFLSFPLSLSIASSLSAIVNASEKEQVLANLKRIIRMLAILLLPFAFGVFAATIITTNTEQRNWITSLMLYHFVSLLPFAFLPSAFIWLQDMFKGEMKSVRRFGIWLGVLWALLYLSLGLQFYSYPG